MNNNGVIVLIEREDLVGVTMKLRKSPFTFARRYSIFFESTLQM
jgi:hypothetical protein